MLLTRHIGILLSNQCFSNLPFSSEKCKILTNMQDLYIARNIP